MGPTWLPVHYGTADSIHMVLTAGVEPAQSRVRAESPAVGRRQRGAGGRSRTRSVWGKSPVPGHPGRHQHERVSIRPVTYANSSLDPETALHPAHARPTTIITRLNDNLYFGGVLNGIPLPVKIKHLISAYPAAMYALGHPMRSMLFVPFPDTEDLSHIPAPGVLVGAAQWINACRYDAPTLVHCEGGLNRSALLVGLALVLNGEDLSVTLHRLRERRSPDVLCNVAFEQWLVDNAEFLRS